jgi:hypothetical protein
MRVACHSEVVWPKTAFQCRLGFGPAEQPCFALSGRPNAWVATSRRSAAAAARVRVRLGIERERMKFRDDVARNS